MPKETHKTPSYTWTHLRSPSRKEITELASELGFSSLHVDDVLASTQRSKIEREDTYTFFIVKFPVYAGSDHDLFPAEVDFFVTPTHLVTISREDSPAIEKFFHRLLSDDEQLLNAQKTPTLLAVAMLKRILTSISPYLDDLAGDIDSVEKQLFHKRADADVIQISTEINLAIITLQKMLKPLRSMIKDLHNQSDEETEPFVSDVMDIAEHIWSFIESEDATLDELQRMNESMISMRTSEIMKTLTILSVIMLPLTILTGLFGMNFFHLPLIASPFGFWAVLGMMTLVVFGMGTYFRRNRWL